MLTPFPPAAARKKKIPKIFWSNLWERKGGEERERVSLSVLFFGRRCHTQGLPFRANLYASEAVKSVGKSPKLRHGRPKKALLY